MFLKLESPRNITGSLKTQNCQVQGNTQSQPGPVSRVKDFGWKGRKRISEVYLEMESCSDVWFKRIEESFSAI